MSSWFPTKSILRIVVLHMCTSSQSYANVSMYLVSRCLKPLVQIYIKPSPVSHLNRSRRDGFESSLFITCGLPPCLLVSPNSLRMSFLSSSSTSTLMIFSISFQCVAVCAVEHGPSKIIPRPAGHSRAPVAEDNLDRCSYPNKRSSKPSSPSVQGGRVGLVISVPTSRHCAAG